MKAYLRHPPSIADPLTLNLQLVVPRIGQGMSNTNQLLHVKRLQSLQTRRGGKNHPDREGNRRWDSISETKPIQPYG